LRRGVSDTLGQFAQGSGRDVLGGSADALGFFRKSLSIAARRSRFQLFQALRDHSHE